jgi:predicted nucleotidyltransferase
MMEPSFEKLLGVLAEAGVQFVLVGGLAVTLQGYVRFTEDVDLLIGSSRDNVARLLDSLSDYGEGFSRELLVDDFTDEEGAIRIVEETEQCQLDVFTRMSGRTYEDVVLDADVFKLGTHQIYYASKNSLIGWKEKSVREKDRLDALALRELMNNPKAFD